jgi:hypothetical protein
MKNQSRHPSTRKAPQITAGDPIVDLAGQLLLLWNADDGAERENDALEYVKRNCSNQFAEWRGSLETVASFTRAESLQGALVQMALALDAIEDVFAGQGTQKALRANELRLQRLMLSAIRAVHASMGSAIDPSVQELVRIYSGEPGLWIDNANRWAARGEEARREDPGAP